MLGGGRPALLPAGRLDIRRLVDANIVEPSNKDIRCEYLGDAVVYLWVLIALSSEPS